MKMKQSFAIALTAATLGAPAWSAPARAADLGYAPPPDYSFAPEQQATLGNGWYLRGDAAWARETPPALAPDAALASALGTHDGWAASIGAGYQFNNYFRTDVTLEYRNKLPANARSTSFDCVTDVVGVSDAGGAPIGVTAQTGDCFSAQRANFKRTSLLANAYIDLGTWAGVTPYIGAGAGMTYGRANGSYAWFHGNGAHYAPHIVEPGGFPPTWVTANGDPASAPPGFAFGSQSRRVDLRKRQTNFTWALMAGVAVDVAPNAKIDLGYRFLNLGSQAPGAPKKDGRIHEYRMGLRYMVD